MWIPDTVLIHRDIRPDDVQVDSWAVIGVNSFCLCSVWARNMFCGVATLRFAKAYNMSLPGGLALTQEVFNSVFHDHLLGLVLSIGSPRVLLRASVVPRGVRNLVLSYSTVNVGEVVQALQSGSYVQLQRG